MDSGERLLITGGGGRVAMLVRPYLRQAGLKLRLLDRNPIAELGEDEEVVCDLADQDSLRAAMSGCTAVLHLAGCTTDAPWEDQIAGNVSGCIGVFEAARAAGVERVIYASSNHVVGMYPQIAGSLLLLPSALTAATASPKRSANCSVPSLRTSTGSGCCASVSVRPSRDQLTGGDSPSGSAHAIWPSLWPSA